jgi:tetratricopeptide (TPR) repeat protein
MSSAKRRRQKRAATPNPSVKTTRETTAAPTPPSVSGLRLWLFRLVSVLVAPLLLVLLEVGLRLGGYGYPTGFYVETGRVGIERTNDRFGWRFFPPSIARSPEPELLPAKAPGTIRIFVLGGSAAQGVPNPRFSFGRILEVMLRDRYPGTRFEVVNAAMTAINSYVVLEIARDCARQHPTAFVVYMGNNEVVGPFGPGTVFQQWSPSLPLVRAGLRLRATRTGQLLDRAVRSFHPEKTSRTWQGMGMFTDKAVTADDPRLVATYANFSQNLRDICRVARRAGAPVILSTVAVNLRDCPPFASRHRADLRPDELSAWDSTFRAGVELEERRQWSEALARYESAARVDDRFAELQFRMGSCLAALGRLREARERFLAAADLDALRFRADREINAAIRRVAVERAADGVYPGDPEESLAAASDSGAAVIPGKDTFYDHVHYTFAGNYFLARTILDRLESALPDLRTRGRSTSVLTEEECARALPMTPWDEYQSLVQMLATMSRAPFSNQPGHAAQVLQMRQDAESLRKQASTPEALEEARRLYEAALVRSPDDWSLHYHYGKLLLGVGQVEAAAHHMSVALTAYPWHVPLYVDLAQAELANGRKDTAIGLLQKALVINPDNAVAHADLVSPLAGEGRIDEAAAHFRRAVEIDPGDYDAYINMGIALGSRGDIDGAMTHFRKAVEINPENPVPYHDLGTALASQGRADEAITNFRKAVEIDPNYEAAHLSLGIALVGRGEIEEAMGHFRKALEINPRNAVAHNDLGIALAGQGRVDEAVACFRSAVDVDPSYVDARINLARMLGGQGRIDEAVAQMRRAVEIDPANPAAYYGLGQLLAVQGRVDEALAAYREALRIRPDYEDARRELQSLQRVGTSTARRPAP